MSNILRETRNNRRIAILLCTVGILWVIAVGKDHPQLKPGQEMICSREAGADGEKCHIVEKEISRVPQRQSLMPIESLSGK